MAYYPLVKKRHKQKNKPQWYVFTEGEHHKIKRSQALKDYFPQLLFYRKIDGNEAELDAESDGETNYNIHNSLATRHAYQ